jgi:hypothetical protein
MASGSPQQHDHSYDLVIDLMRERMTAQSDRANTLDAKANGIMTVATTILATALILQAALFAISSSHSIALNLARLQWVLLTLLVIYLLTMISATVSGYWLRKFNRSPEPKGLEIFATQPQIETQSYVVGTMKDAFYKNEKIINFKVLGLRIATVGLLLEIITLCVLLFMQTQN